MTSTTILVQQACGEMAVTLQRQRLKKSFRLKTKPGTLLKIPSESLKQNPAVFRGYNLHG